VSHRCTDPQCEVSCFARKFEAWLKARGWHVTTFGAVVWHKGNHHLTIDPEVDILGMFASAEGMAVDALRAEVEAIK